MLPSESKRIRVGLNNQNSNKQAVEWAKVINDKIFQLLMLYFTIKEALLIFRKLSKRHFNLFFKNNFTLQTIISYDWGSFLSKHWKINTLTQEIICKMYNDISTVNEKTIIKKFAKFFQYHYSKKITLHWFDNKMDKIFVYGEPRILIHHLNGMFFYF